MPRLRRSSFARLPVLLSEPLAVLASFLVLSVPLYRGLVLAGFGGFWSVMFVELGAYVVLRRLVGELPLPRPTRPVGLLSRPEPQPDAREETGRERRSITMLMRASGLFGALLMWPVVYGVIDVFEIVYGMHLGYDSYENLLLAIAAACFLACRWISERVLLQYSPAVPEWWPRPLSEEPSEAD